MHAIRVVVADDHPIMRAGIRVFFDRTQDIQVVGEAGTAEDALRLVQERQPDILLLDLKLPDRSGIEVARVLHHGKSQVQVIILSGLSEPMITRRLLGYKIAGYIVKGESATVLVDAVRAIGSQRTKWFSAEVLATLTVPCEDKPARKSLSDREVEVLRLLATGKTNNGIGKVLKISPKTVERHLDSVYRKLQVRSRAEAAVVAAQAGFLL